MIYYIIFAFILFSLFLVVRWCFKEPDNKGKVLQLYLCIMVPMILCLYQLAEDNREHIWTGAYRINNSSRYHGAYISLDKETCLIRSEKL